jgi:pyrroloquinoline quinone (PQQ) biosynthesis protein C
MIRTTLHPDWIHGFLDTIEPYKDRVVHNEFFRDISSGTLTIQQFRGALINFYPLIDSFPKYMALNLTKVPANANIWNKKTRFWLIKNINQERLHTGWWQDFASGFGVPKSVLDDEIHPPAAMDAINNYLWRISTHGSLAEGISAVNYAIEGPTGEWTKAVLDGIKKYKGVEGTRITDRTLEWVQAHAEYDDRHPEEALEIIKAYATTKAEQDKVTYAAIRSLEYYYLALDRCYELFK